MRSVDSWQVRQVCWTVVATTGSGGHAGSIGALAAGSAAGSPDHPLHALLSTHFTRATAVPTVHHTLRYSIRVARTRVRLQMIALPSLFPQATISSTQRKSDTTPLTRPLSALLTQLLRDAPRSGDACDEGLRGKRGG